MITNVLFIGFLVAVLLLVKYFKSSKGKGKAGEWLVAQVLKQLGPGYEVLNNLTFVVEGDSTQIDHVVISTKGVFTIETKNYQGSIFGQASDAKWTQKLGGRSFQFQNPIRQNYKHVKFLAEQFAVKETAIIPMITFLGQAKFPKGKPEGVYSPLELAKAIKAKDASVLNNAQTFAIRRKLETMGATTGEKTETHLQNLAQRHRGK